MRGLLSVFRLEEHGTTVGREVLAGVVTFCTLSYILFVQPAVLSNTGMDPEGVLFATCVASAFACLLMGLLANYPVALAPGMGSNFLFAFTVCLTMGWPWEQALAANGLAGMIFLVLTFTGFRERVMHALPEGLRYAIGVGIGLLIATVGFRWGGLTTPAPATHVALADLHAPVPVLTLVGLAITAALVARKVPGAILIGIVITAAVGAFVAHPDPEVTRFLVEIEAGEIIGAPPTPEATAAKLDVAGLFARPFADWLTVLLVFFFLDLFDTVGTLVGVGEQAGLLKDGKLVRARGAFLADAAGTVAGSVLGTSTVTSYVESAAGVTSGGRTGLVAVTCAACFLLALFFAPLLTAIGAGVEVAGVTYYPVLAPVLILIGALMTGAVRRVAWDDPVEAIPCFLTIIVMPLSLSITDGIAWGLMSASLLRIVTGRAKEMAWLMHALAAALLARELWLAV